MERAMIVLIALVILWAMWLTFPTHRTALCFIVASVILVCLLALRFFTFMGRRKCPACHAKHSVVVHLDLGEESDSAPSLDWVPADCTQCKKQFRIYADGEFHDRHENA